MQKLWHDEKDTKQENVSFASIECRENCC